MRIFLTGISCIGKTVIGAKLAALFGNPFYDLDEEVEKYFSTSIEHLQDKFLTMYSFREEASKALRHLLRKNESRNSVISLPPSGLMHGYWRIVKKSERTIVVLTDNAENILHRITFYDKDSNLIEKHLTEKEKTFYLKDIKKDITYFNRTYKRAHITVNIAGLTPNKAAIKVKEILKRDHAVSGQIDISEYEVKNEK